MGPGRGGRRDLSSPLEERCRGGDCGRTRILGHKPQPRQPAFFWSDQFGLRLQLVGRADARAIVEIEGGDEDFLARFVEGEGTSLQRSATGRRTHLRRQLALAA